MSVVGLLGDSFLELRCHVCPHGLLETLHAIGDQGQLPRRCTKVIFLRWEFKMPNICNTYPYIYTYRTHSGAFSVRPRSRVETLRAKAPQLWYCIERPPWIARSRQKKANKLARMTSAWENIGRMICLRWRDWPMDAHGIVGYCCVLEHVCI